MAKSYKLGKNLKADRVLKIKSYEISLPVLIENFFTDSKTSSVITKVLAAVGDSETVYNFPLPLTIDDDYEQNWSKNSLTSSFMKNISDASRGLQGITGYGVNPFYAQTYQGQVPRSISLAFQLNAETADLFDVFDKALKNLKADMLPGSPIGSQEGGKSESSNASSGAATIAAKEVFQAPPRLFSLQFGQETSHINRVVRFDLCALASMDINYGADGVMGLSEGSKPKSIAVNMTFLEFEPKEKEDWVYKNNRR